MGSPRERQPSTPPTSAPLGVKLICLVGAIAASLTVLLSVPIAVGGGPPAVELGIVVLFLGLVQFYVLYGLWTVQPWSWMWGMILFGFGALMDVFQANAIGLVVNVIFLAYLFTKRDVYRS